jgi:hypothetical protein
MQIDLISLFVNAFKETRAPRSLPVIMEVFDSKIGLNQRFQGGSPGDSEKIEMGKSLGKKARKQSIGFINITKLNRFVIAPKMLPRDARAPLTSIKTNFQEFGEFEV